MSKKSDKRLARMRRAVVVNVLTKPGATEKGPVINLNDPRQTGDGHWLMQSKKSPAPKPEKKVSKPIARDEAVRALYTTMLAEDDYDHGSRRGGLRSGPGRAAQEDGSKRSREPPWYDRA